MRHHRSRHSPHYLVPGLAWLLLIGLTCLPLSSLPDTQTKPLPGAGAPTLETLDQLHRQLEALRQRVHGLEGKLKESALSRREADQARMEAERRLAEGTQRLDQLKEETSSLKTTQTTLEQRLLEREAVIARLSAELQAEREANEALTTRLHDLADRLPETEGGNLSAEAARQSAAAALLTLRTLSKNTEKKTTDPAIELQIQNAEAELQRAQFKLASVMAAKCLYRVRANDTLASISHRFHGSGGQWQALFEANRHLLDNPNQLTPGITLIIP